MAPLKLQQLRPQWVWSVKMEKALHWGGREEDCGQVTAAGCTRQHGASTETPARDALNVHEAIYSKQEVVTVRYFETVATIA